MYLSEFSYKNIELSSFLNWCVMLADETELTYHRRILIIDVCHDYKNYVNEMSFRR